MSSRRRGAAPGRPSEELSVRSVVPRRPRWPPFLPLGATRAMPATGNCLARAPSYYYTLTINSRKGPRPLSARSLARSLARCQGPNATTEEGSISLFAAANGPHAFVMGFVDPSALLLLEAAHHRHIDHGLGLGLARQKRFAATESWPSSVGQSRKLNEKAAS